MHGVRFRMGHDIFIYIFYLEVMQVIGYKDDVYVRVRMHMI